MNITEQVRAHLARIEDLDNTYRAIITVDADGAVTAAERSDRHIREGRGRPLEGLIVAVKDNIDTAGIRTTAGSAFFADRIPDSDAVVVQRLADAGAVIVAKANTHEFAFGGTTQNPHYGSCRNAVDAERIPGGSSGGSAVAIGLGMAHMALGTDTGGSIRIPASLNGVSGLRPTHGLVPNTGSTPSAASFDTIGPMARDAATIARSLQIIAGYDIDDAYCVNLPVPDFVTGLDAGIAGLRIGVPTNWFFEDCEPEVVARVREALAVLEQAGAGLVEIELPGAEVATALQSVMMISDARSFHDERIATAPEKFGADVLERLRISEEYSSLDYAEAKRRQAEWVVLLRRVFARVDVIATPTTPRVAPPVADSQHMIATTRTVSRFTYPWSLAGVPALSVPAGRGAHAMPVGLQIIGPWFADARVLRVGATFQKLTDHHLPTRPTGAIGA